MGLRHTRARPRRFEMDDILKYRRTTKGREAFVRDSSLEKKIVVFDNRIIGDNNVDSIVETGVDRKSGFVSANK